MDNVVFCKVMAFHEYQGYSRGLSFLLRRTRVTWALGARLFFLYARAVASWLVRSSPERVVRETKFEFN